MKLAAFQPYRALCIGALIAATAWAAPAVNGSPAGIGPQAGGAYGNPGAVSHGPISQVTGSFDTVVDPSTITSSDPWPLSTGTTVPDAFTLQINTNTFRNAVTNALCVNTTLYPSCRGWQQFVYSRRQSGPPSVFIQFWLYGYSDPHDPGPHRSCDTTNNWIDDPKGCYRTEGVQIAPALTAAGLSTVQFKAEAGRGANPQDRVTITVGAGTPAAASASMAAPSLLGLGLGVGSGQEWNQVEWNVLGDGAARNVTFQNVPSTTPVTLVPRITLVDGTPTAPGCFVMDPSSAETSNLGFRQTSLIVSGAGPAMTFKESSDSVDVASCALTHSWGDTHLRTIGGLMYDFQATGDFVLARIDKDFAVQARQVKVARWPDAAVNQAVGLRVGKHRVAICLAQPARVVVDGESVSLKDGERRDLADLTNVRRAKDGERRALPDHANLRRSGNVYIVQGSNGHSLRAELNDGYINASVGLGRWPAEVSGLLADAAPAEGAASTAPRLVSRDGKTLPESLDFAMLYGTYAQSWRVNKDDEQLLADCGQLETGQGVPAKPFGPKQLGEKERERARAICTEAGVRHPAFLQACIVDVAALDNPRAAAVFAGLPPPVAVVKLESEGDEGTLFTWSYRLGWCLLAIVVLWLLARLWRRRVA